MTAAGLNPALLYTKGGPGGSTGGSGTSVGGAQAADTAQMQNAHTSQVMTSIALMKAESEIEVNRSIAEKNRADAAIQTEGKKFHYQ